MKILKKINTNAALAIDSAGREVVVFGKGVGFPSTPYELDDMRKIDRSFYDIDPKYLSLIAELPENCILAGAEITEKAEITLDCELSPNLPFTLADHLSFAVSRVEGTAVVLTPLAYDVRHLYPKETELGFAALKIMQHYTGVTLPEAEAYAIAMHIINAEANTGTIGSMMKTLKVVHEMEKIVESCYNRVMDKETYSYSRFVLHLQYLVQRLSSENQAEERCGLKTLVEMAQAYPNAFTCANEIAEYLKRNHNWRCNNEEILYLMLHIQRVQDKDPA